MAACTDNDSHESVGTYASHVDIIPQPVTMNYGQADMLLPSSVSLSTDFSDITAQLLKESLTKMVPQATVTTAANEQAFIRTEKDNTLKEEAYKLVIADKSITISYASPQGMLWGVQTLRQILLQGKSSSAGLSLPLLSITDQPKNAWRAFHIDVVRHMFTMDYLKKLVDQLSFYKINRLQMHLTDDQGWRIEIKKYPSLTTIGGWRTFDKYDRECLQKAATDPSYTIDDRFIRNGNEYGGYYTQAQLKEFINYATQRGLEVIPEIDMPGHFSSAIKAFPELSCTGGTGWGEEFSNPICAGKTQNYAFLKDIISEVADLFPSKYFHIGADEVEKTSWKNCPDCQALIREKNLKDEDGLQNYFVHEMAAFVRSKGKEPMAWDDAFHETNPEQLLYTFWRDWKADEVGEMTQRGLPVIFMEWGHFYLSADPTDELLKELYNFDFQPKFKGVVRQNIKGYQACVWTEMIPNETKMGEHLFPSLQAFTELTWSRQADWGSFVNRLPWHLKFLHDDGLTYRTPDFLK
ncbi:hypothetical protein PRBRB14_18680 [Hallella multisaccharivorax DSM 17128]|nr:hypothetical protein PRBRB14_18680 [Hallella multisaccharivorax DSM 17128]